MDYSYINNIVEAINRTCEIKFEVEPSQYENLSFTSISEKALVQIGPSSEAIMYLHLFGWREIVHHYLIQNEFAENGMYGCANNIISQLTRELFSLKSLKMKMKSYKAPNLLNSVALVMLFHEFGHIAFSHSSVIKEDYFNTVHRYIDINPIQEVQNGLVSLFSAKEERPPFKCGIDDIGTVEEIASDYFAIELIFKLNKVKNIGRDKVIDFCFAMIYALTLSYRITAFKCCVKNKEEKLIFERLPQFCYRRMLVFDRMRDVLFNEFDIDNDRFGAECQKINIEYDEIMSIKHFCQDVFELISSKNSFILDPNKDMYFRNLKLLNSNFCSNSFSI